VVTTQTIGDKEKAKWKKLLGITWCCVTRTNSIIKLVKKYDKKKKLPVWMYGFTLVVLIMLLFVGSVSSILSGTTKISPELNLSSYSNKGDRFGKVVAASCGYDPYYGYQYPNEGHMPEDFQSCSNAVYSCPGGGTSVGAGTSLCGGTCQPLPNPVNPVDNGCPYVCTGTGKFDLSCGYSCAYSCPTGYSGNQTAINANTPNSCYLSTTCGMCPEGLNATVAYTGYQTILNNIHYYTDTTGQPTPTYSLGNCPTALQPHIQRIVEIQRYGSDGANTSTWTENYDTSKTTWTNQAAKTYPYNEYLRIRAGYWNTTTGSYESQGAWVQANAATLHPDYGKPCTNTDNCSVVTNGTIDTVGVCNAPVATYAACSKANVCGQMFPGYQCPSGCSADNSYTNNSCITQFEPSSTNVNPNGSVEFTWSLQNSTSTAKCSFVDLTTPTPRPIPGLQDLNVLTDRSRITNIQASTRFCLVCGFYNSVTGALLGEAVKHQWIRVQRIGEN
jgi:hypothetical protein